MAVSSPKSGHGITVSSISDPGLNFNQFLDDDGHWKWTNRNGVVALDWAPDGSITITSGGGGGGLPTGLTYVSPCFTVGTDTTNQVETCGSAGTNSVTITSIGQVPFVIASDGSGTAMPLVLGNNNTLANFDPALHGKIFLVGDTIGLTLDAVSASTNLFVISADSTIDVTGGASDVYVIGDANQVTNPGSNTQIYLFGVGNEASNLLEGNQFAIGRENTHDTTGGDGYSFGTDNEIEGSSELMALGWSNSLGSQDSTSNTLAVGESNSLSGGGGTLYAFGANNSISTDQFAAFVLGYGHSASPTTQKQLFLGFDSSFDIGATGVAVGVSATPEVLVTASGLTLNARTGTPVAYACFDSAGRIVESALPCV